MPAGGQLTLGNGSVDLGCNDLTVAGSLSISAGAMVSARNVLINAGTVNAGGGTLSVSGDWTNLGQFNAQNGNVQFVDGCSTADATVTGNTTFARLTAISSSGKRLIFSSGSIQTVTAGLSLAGVSGNRLLLGTSQAGVTAALNLASGASDSVSWLDVRDIDASGGKAIAQGSPATFNSINSGNSNNWFVAAMNAVAVNTLPLPAMVLLVLLLTLLVGRKLTGTVLRA